jgi:hypothetical protein
MTILPAKVVVHPSKNIKIIYFSGIKTSVFPKNFRSRTTTLEHMGWGCDLEDRAPSYAREVLTHLCFSARLSSSLAIVWYANDMT